MDIVPVVGSSVIVGYGFEVDAPDPEATWPAREKTGLLAVRFSDGRTFLYSRVPERVFESFLLADSRGSYWRREIAGKYEAREDEGLRED